MTKTDIFKNEKNVILISSIVIFLSVFLWDFKYHFFQAKYLISVLLIYNFIFFKKDDLKYYFYFLCFCFLIVIHFSFTNTNLIFDKYISFSVIFLFIYLSVLYKLNLFFDKILNKSVTIFIIILNVIFLLELMQFDFYIYDHPNMVNGLCTICHKDEYFIFDKIFIEKSHLGMMSSAVIIFSFAQFKNKNKLEKINIIFFTIVTFIFFISFTLILGIIISSIVLLTFGLLNKFKNNVYILFPFIISLCIFISIPNCWGRLYQVLNLEILYEKEEKKNIAKSFGKHLSNLKQKTFGKISYKSPKEIKEYLNEDKELRHKIEILQSTKNLIILKEIRKEINKNLFQSDGEDIVSIVKRIIESNLEIGPKYFKKKLNSFFTLTLKSSSQKNFKEVVLKDFDNLIEDLEKEIQNKKKDGRSIKDYENLNQLIKIFQNDTNIKSLLKEKEQLDLKYKKAIDEINNELNLLKKKRINITEKKNKEKYFLDESINATTIVHLNHYMIAFKSLKERPLGYGFQNYKQASQEFAKKNIMIDVYRGQIFMNINDGSNNFNKLIVEFGYINILFIILFFIFNSKGNMNNESKIFVLTIIITQFLRAAGYFNGGFLFVIIAGTFSIFIKQKK